MFNWMKRVIAAGVMTLAVTSTTGALVAPAYAADDKKPAVTAPAVAPGAPAAAATAEPAPIKIAENNMSQELNEKAREQHANMKNVIVDTPQAGPLVTRNTIT